MEPFARYTAIGESLRELAGITPGQMFGKPCIQLEGRAFAAFYQESMVFKLTGEPHLQAIHLEGARLWDPSGKRRPMKDWVQVPFTHEATWETYAGEALAHCRHCLSQV